jgi:hypothetical protein
MPRADLEGSSVTDEGALAQAFRAPAVEENCQNQDLIGALWSAPVAGHWRAFEAQHRHRFGERVSLLVQRLLADLIPPGH